MIPKKIHQIWIGPYKMPSRETSFVELIKTKQNDFEHFFWTNENIPTLPNPLKEIYDFLGNKKEYVYQSDLLRIFIINKFGGVYMDVDFEFKSGFSNFHLENYEAFFCTHFGNVDTFPNGIFGMSPNHPISQIMLDDIVKEYPRYWWYGPSWIAKMIKKYFSVTDNMIYENFAKTYFDTNCIFHINYDIFHVKHYFHHALYSWSPENKKKFEEGKIE